MTAPTEPCPRCRRNNAVHRMTCIYCGTAMPNPRPELAPVRRELPANFDELVRKAMTGGGSVDQIRAALHAGKDGGPVAQTEVPPPTPTFARQVPPPPALGNAPPVAGVLVAASPPEVRASVDPIDRLHEAATLARDARSSGDSARLDAALTAAEEALVSARAAWRASAASPGPPLAPDPPEAPALAEEAGETSGPRGFPLPPIRHAYALVVGGGGPERLEILAQALEVDPATARAIANTPHTRVALRASEPGALERRATRARAAGLVSRVIARGDLTQTPAAATIVRIGPGLAGAAVDADLWQSPPNPDEVPPGTEVDLAEVVLVVVGEVEVREAADPREQSRWERTRLTTGPSGRERRTTVLDLHTVDSVYRVVEGVTMVMAEDGTSGRGGGALRSWVTTIPSRLLAPVEPRRVCPVDVGGGNTRRGSGWPTWEEHSRMCRLLHDIRR